MIEATHQEGTALATTQDFRNGFAFRMDGNIYFIVEFQHVKPGKGGAFVRTRMKNVQNGLVIDRTFKSGEVVDEIRVENRDMQYIYKEGDHYVFMDTTSYEQIHLPHEIVDDSADLLKENETVTVIIGDDVPLLIELPNHVTLKVVETDPGVRGDTATGGTKPATVETGAVVQVPLFLGIGETIRIDTRTRQYLSRA
jgi:elongation factor P